MSKKSILDTCQRLPSAEGLPLSTLGWWNWQTRTFEGRMPKGLRVQVPPRAPQFSYVIVIQKKVPKSAKPQSDPHCATLVIDETM
jgi:hypothetical protein